MKKLMIVLGLFAFAMANGQEKIDSNNTAAVVLSGYVEAYYSYDFNKPSNNDKAPFLYSHNRHNEFNLNIGYIKAAYAAQNIRANIALAAGTYINANYAAEPGVLKNIFEANAGIKLLKNKNLWLDAGIFSSHIGFESAISKDCWNLTRSIAAENSPYYESGAKITYTSANSKWLLSALALNGWQRIKRVDGNSLMSFGMQVQFKPSAKTTLNYSNFIGTDKPDSSRLMRYYHDLYAIYTIGPVNVTTGFDIGMEQKSKGSATVYTWYSPIIVVKYALSDKWAVAGRFEYYSDNHGVIVSAYAPNQLSIFGQSLNIDYSPVSNAVVRIEMRTLHNKDDIFSKSSGSTHNNSFITGSLAVSF